MSRSHIHFAFRPGGDVDGRYVIPSALRFCLLALLLLSSPVRADDAPPLLRQGFAFNRPPILIQQHLFGLAHGVALLAAACAQDAPYRDASATAYRAWNERQAPAIAAATRDLAQYYFGDRAGEARRSDIVHALGLKDQLDQAAGSKELQDACATFPQALRNPRYDLIVQYRLQLMAARLETGSMIEAVADACRASIPQREAEALDAAYRQWHGEHAAELTEARAVLEAEWPALQWQGTLDQFVKGARQRGKMSATPARCKEMARKTPIKDDNANDTHAKP